MCSELKNEHFMSTSRFILWRSSANLLQMLWRVHNVAAEDKLLLLYQYIMFRLSHIITYSDSWSGLALNFCCFTATLCKRPMSCVMFMSQVSDGKSVDHAERCIFSMQLPTRPSSNLMFLKPPVTHRTPTGVSFGRPGVDYADSCGC